MNRAACFLIVVVAGCQTPERAAIKPLPEDAPPPPYAELVDRAHSQVAAGQAFFYRDSWTDVEQTADALQQTAKLLGKVPADAIPAKQKNTLPKQADELSKAATDLHAAAKAKDVNKTNEVLQKLNLKVRELRPEPTEPAKP